MATDSSFVVPPDATLPSQPVDTAGGNPASYTQDVLDLFKFGIGAAISAKLAPQVPADAQYQTTNGVVNKVGSTANRTATGVATPASGMSMTTMLMIGGGVLIALLLLKKAL